MDEAKQVTLKLVSQRTSALLRFEDLCVRRSVDWLSVDELQWICDGVRAKQLLSESAPLPYVSILPARCISLLMPPLSLPQSADSRPVGCSTSFYGRRHLLKWFIVSIVSQRAKLGCVFCFLEYTEEQSMILRKVTSEFETNLSHDTFSDFVVSVGTKESHEEDCFRRISLC